MYNDKEYKFKQLHALWDSGLNKLPEGFQFPLKEEDYTVIKNLATSLINEIPVKDLPELDKNLTIESWVGESWEACKYVVYSGIKPGDTIQEEYLVNGFKLAKHRIVLAGLRLSKIIQEAYSSYGKAINKNDDKSNAAFLGK